MMTIQVGGSPTGDESSELVTDDERFFSSKISQKFALFFIKD